MFSSYVTTAEPYTIQAVDAVINGAIPMMWQTPTVPMTDDRTRRNLFREVRNAGMYALVDMSWTRKLAGLLQGKWAIEVMAGRGWLAKALAAHGVDVIATDDGSWSMPDPVTHVEKMDALTAIEEYKYRDVLIMSWPPMEDIAAEIVERWTGDIVYIGEGLGGCTGTDAMFSLLEQRMTVATLDIPQWWGIHDYLVYYSKEQRS